MYDYWMLIIGGVVGAWGVWGLITGSTTIYYQSRRGWGGQRPLFTYQGRGLAWIMVLLGGLLLGLYALSHGGNTVLTPAKATSIAWIVVGAGLLLGIIVSFIQGLGIGNVVSSRSAKRPKGLSLTEAAKSLQMPEADLLQMAQNGGIEATHEQGTYTFRPDVLQSFKESMAHLHERPF